jgi:Carbohydrate binding module (family 6).
MKMGNLNLLLIGITTLMFSVSAVAQEYAGKPFENVVHKGGPQEIPGRLFCAYYDFGGEGVAYHDSDNTNSGSGAYNPLNGTYLHAFRIAESVDISYTKGNDIDISPYNMVEPPLNTLYIGWTNPGEWTKYTVDVKKAGKYSVNLMYTSYKGGKISLSANDKDISGPIAIKSTYHKDEPVTFRQWHHWNKMEGIVEVELKEGIQVLTLHTVEEGQMNYMWLDFIYISE